MSARHCLHSVSDPTIRQDSKRKLMQTGSETDSSDSLKKIPEIYQALLQKKGVFEATKTMVALLMERS